MTEAEQIIRRLISEWSKAVEAKDPPRIIADYADDAVLFDAVPPGATTGAQNIAAVWAQAFPCFPDKFRSEHKGLKVFVDGDVAFAFGYHHFVPTPADHPCGASWMRVTVGFQRVNGAWKVVHEHVSVPFDPMSGKAERIASV